MSSSNTERLIKLILSAQKMLHRYGKKEQKNSKTFTLHTATMAIRNC